MTIRRLSIFIIPLFSVCIFGCISNRKKNVANDKDIIARWYRVSDTIVYHQIDISRSDTIIFEEKYSINAVDSFFILKNKKIYLFGGGDKLAKFTNIAKYFDDNLPPIGFDIEITLWMAAIVNEDGSVDYVGITKKPSNRAYILPTVDVIRKMPRWSPAHIGDEKVASLVMFPVHHKVK